MNEKDAINILLIILKVANQGEEYDNCKKKMTTMTTNKAMYAVLFKHPKMKEYWNALIEKGLINFDPNTNSFKTTEEGRAFLKAYKAVDYDVIKASTRTSSSTSSPSMIKTAEQNVEKFMTWESPAYGVKINYPSNES